MKSYALLIVTILLISCKHKKIKENTKSAENTSLYNISPIYGDSIYFNVGSTRTDELRVSGNVEGFNNNKRTLNEIYFQRFAQKEGTFRKIHVIGTALETNEENRKEITKASHFDQYVKFDELGIFAGEPGDPVDLIPLYPGHRVRKGEWWNSVAKVKIAMGEGEAIFRSGIDSVFTDKQHHQLARIKVKFSGNIIPDKKLAGWNVSVQGEGWFNWNCSINQRRDTHISATYLAQKETLTIKQIVTVNDTLIVEEKKRVF